MNRSVVLVLLLCATQSFADRVAKDAQSVTPLLPGLNAPAFTARDIQGEPFEFKPDALEKIQLGMTRSEITTILGTPVLIDPFRTNRWDYIYRYYPRGRTSEALIESRVTLFFEDDVLVKIDYTDYNEPKSDDEKKEE